MDKMKGQANAVLRFSQIASSLDQQQGLLTATSTEIK